MKRIFIFLALLTYLCLWNLEVSAQTPAAVSAQTPAQESAEAAQKSAPAATSQAAVALHKMNHEKQGFPDFGFMVSS